MKRAKKKARPAGGTARQATETGTTGQVTSTSTYNDTITRRGGQGKTISKLLLEGAQNGLHLHDLVRITGWTEREVRQQIHHERRGGAPILSDNLNGYFLPADEQERAACVRSLRHRAKEILAAADAIEQTEG